MKVFFKKQKKSYLRKFLPMLCIALIGMLIVSQWYILSEKSAVPASSGDIMTDKISDVITLTASKELKAGDASIYLNGEEYAPFTGNNLEICVYANSVIEVLSMCKNEFDVSFSSTDANLTVISDGKKVRCQKGINFICRTVAR